MVLVGHAVQEAVEPARRSCSQLRFEARRNAGPLQTGCGARFGGCQSAAPVAALLLVAIRYIGLCLRYHSWAPVGQGIAQLELAVTRQAVAASDPHLDVFPAAPVFAAHAENDRPAAVVAELARTRTAGDPC